MSIEDIVGIRVGNNIICKACMTDICKICITDEMDFSLDEIITKTDVKASERYFYCDICKNKLS